MAALQNRLQPLLVVVLSLFVICEPHVVDEKVADSIPGPSPVLQELRNRWGAADIVRDINHIKEDISKITQLQDIGAITTNEALFYFLRMHDFDDNGKLDGHELIAAMKHTTDHSGVDSMPFSEVEESNSDVMQMANCIREAVPPQVYEQCCERENRCSVARQQNRGFDCITRMIVKNSSTEWNSQMTSSSRERQQSEQWWSDVIRNAVALCASVPRARLHQCLKNEMIRRCRSNETFLGGGGGGNRSRWSSSYNRTGGYDDGQFRAPDEGYYATPYAGRRGQSGEQYGGQNDERFGDQDRRFSAGNEGPFRNPLPRGFQGTDDQFRDGTREDSRRRFANQDGGYFADTEGSYYGRDDLGDDQKEKTEEHFGGRRYVDQ